MSEANADGVGGLRLLRRRGGEKLFAPSKRRPPCAFALRASAAQAPSPAVASAKAGPRHSLRSRGEGSASAVPSLRISRLILLQNQISPLIDLRAPTRRDHRGGVELLDDGGTLDHRADIERI